MPAIITEHSHPIEVTFNIDTSYLFTTYPVTRLDHDPVVGEAQILPYGIAVWVQERRRTVYPWHRVTSLTERF